MVFSVTTAVYSSLFTAYYDNRLKNRSTREAKFEAFLGSQTARSSKTYDSCAIAIRNRVFAYIRIHSGSMQTQTEPSITLT
eukprot:3759-Heterococcus_DN1.PRE.2